jgi:branched-chain amino acid transport system substrate-binding protein
VVTIADGERSKRYARDCQRQGYKHLIVVPDATQNPPASLEGAISPLPSFPWFITSGSPALDEYGAVMKKYVSRTNNKTTSGWVAGKLMEKALTGNVSAKPTRQDVLNGLWKLKGETLGGLSQPLTFPKGKPAVPIACSYEATVKGDKYVSRTGMRAAYCL